MCIYIYDFIELVFFTEVVHPYIFGVILVDFSGSNRTIRIPLRFLKLHQAILVNSIHQTCDEYNWSKAVESYIGIACYTVCM